MTNNQKAMRGMKMYTLEFKSKVGRRIQKRKGYLEKFHDKQAANLQAAAVRVAARKAEAERKRKAAEKAA